MGVSSARRRSTLQVGLPLPSTTATVTPNRELPYRYDPTDTDTLPSPLTDLNESEFSDTDSSTGSPTVTVEISNRLSKTAIRMDSDKQPLAEVITAKMKDCPVLTAGRITPLILQSWSLACKRYMKHAEKKPTEIVSFVAEAMLEPRLVA